MAAAPAKSAPIEQIVTPWQATNSGGGFDYQKLIKQFGSTAIDGDLIRRIELATNVPAHRFLRRGLFFSQRDIAQWLDSFEHGEEVYLYTGRGPTSEAMHLGHMVPIEFTKYLQDAFDAILVVQMSDDEKYYFKDDGHSIEHYQRLGRENARDMIARGFRLNKTYIFSNAAEVAGEMQLNVVRMMRATTGNQIKGIFGLSTEDNNIGEIAWPIYQSVPAYSSSFPHLFGKRKVGCLVPMAIDQDPYFRLARDFVTTGPGRGLLKPAAIHSEFLTGLSGAGDKMSSSVTDAHLKSIFLSDKPAEIKSKITKYAFSGGGATLKEHQERGALLEVDVPFQYLLYFLEDDVELERIATEYGQGRMKTSEIKAMMVNTVVSFVEDHQRNKALVTDAVVDAFFSKSREFDHGRTTRTALVPRPAAEYDKLGANFDRYFGQAKPHLMSAPPV